MILNVDRITFRYPGRGVLKDVTLAAKGGDCLAILGTNGAGKTTLLRCMNKILKPQQGVIAIEHEKLSKLTPREVAKKVGYVSQRQDNGRVTVFDAVMLGRRPHITWDITERDLEITSAILKVFGLEPFSLRYLDELSGGELQKVLIARALAQEPRVLLLDEPTSNLDLKNQLEVLGIIKDVVVKRQIAAVVAMHDLNLAIRFARRFIFLKGGRIFAAGGEEIVTPETIEAVYGVPVAVERFGDLPVVIPLWSAGEASSFRFPGGGAAGEPGMIPAHGSTAARKKRAKQNRVRWSCSEKQ